MTTAVTETAAAFEAGRTSGEAEDLELGKYWIVPTADGVEQIDLTDDQYRDYPARIRQTVHLSHVDSLIAMWDKHSDDDSDMYADREKRTITAILDGHHGISSEDGSIVYEDSSRARWQQHRAVVTLALSDPMKAWLGKNNELFKQEAFAEFVEDWMPYIVDPEAADLLEMAQSFQATTSAAFKSGYKLVNGQRVLEYTEQIEASATVRGDSIAVPSSLSLRLPVWRGASTGEDFTARIRYRTNHGGAGHLGIGYKLDRPAETVDAAFEAEIARVEQHIGRPVLRGTPAGV
jgi:uncharacterized protein YfdQ (DUF2303 family)